MTSLSTFLFEFNISSNSSGVILGTECTISNRERPKVLSAVFAPLMTSSTYASIVSSIFSICWDASTIWVKSEAIPACRLTDVLVFWEAFTKIRGKSLITISKLVSGFPYIQQFLVHNKRFQLELEQTYFPWSFQ